MFSDINARFQTYTIGSAIQDVIEKTHRFHLLLAEYRLSSSSRRYRVVKSDSNLTLLGASVGARTSGILEGSLVRARKWMLTIEPVGQIQKERVCCWSWLWPLLSHESIRLLLLVGVLAWRPDGKTRAWFRPSTVIRTAHWAGRPKLSDVIGRGSH